MSLLAASALMAALSVSGAFAQQSYPSTVPPVPQEKVKIEKFGGVVEGVDQAGQSFTIRKHKQERVFFWNDQTKFSHDEKTLSPLDLKKGEHVKISYLEEGGKSIATTIKIGKMKTSKES